MTTPSTDLPVAASGDALAQPAQPVLPPTLMGVSGDDFLPGPGPWASALGRQLLVLMLLGGGALALWPMRETVKAAGVVRPSGENTVVQSEQGGTVLRVLLRPNQAVRSGDLLAVFDSRPLQAERQQLLEELAMLEGQAPERALAFACSTGALTATRAGAQPSLPTRAEVERILER